ncbi:hypothetical protein [Litoribacillus peritrichatus]|uniref:Uncharacterized protein n=1 Tax=Litoribacillus peritrichatus TaxID=718191 RepID=A0ABP7LYV9_9GAMM
MGTPTKEEMAIALDEAIRLREQGGDDHFLGKSLLSLNYRFIELEHVYQALEHYLNSGQATDDHAKLIKAIEHYRDLELRAKGKEPEAKFGL